MITLAKLRRVLREVPILTSNMDAEQTCKIISKILRVEGMKNFSVDTGSVYVDRIKLKEYHTRIEIGNYIIDYKLAEYGISRSHLAPFITNQAAIYADLYYLPEWRRPADKESIISKSSFNLLCDLYEKGTSTNIKSPRKNYASKKKTPARHRNSKISKKAY
jgi:hypothetical protein